MKYTLPKETDGKTTLQCQFCRKIFKRKIGPRTYEIKCSKCGKYDVDIVGNPKFRTATGEIVEMTEETGSRLGLRREADWKFWKRPTGRVGMSNPGPSTPWKGLPFAPEFYANPRKIRIIKTPRVPKRNPTTQQVGNTLNFMGLASIPLFIGLIIWANNKYGK